MVPGELLEMTAPNLNNPYSIINDAFHDAGLLMEGDTISPEQLVSGMRRLTDLINVWGTQGLKLWLLSDQPVTLLAGQAVYTFKPSGDVNMVKPLSVFEGYFLSSSNIRSPLTVLSWDEYVHLGQVDGNPGAVNSFFVNKLATELDVRFWLTPDATAATGTGHVVLRTQVTNFTNVTETMQFPLEWRMALRWGLADDICTGQPQIVTDRCEKRATAFRQALEDWDVEDAPTQFQPDSRMQSSGGRFR